jgi:hypothetical protein
MKTNEWKGIDSGGEGIHKLTKEIEKKKIKGKRTKSLHPGRRSCHGPQQTIKIGLNSC